MKASRSRVAVDRGSPGGLCVPSLGTPRCCPPLNWLRLDGFKKEDTGSCIPGFVNCSDRFFFFSDFWDKNSLCSRGWPWTQSRLPLLPRCWDQRCTFWFSMLTLHQRQGRGLCPNVPDGHGCLPALYLTPPQSKITTFSAKSTHRHTHSVSRDYGNIFAHLASPWFYKREYNHI